MAAKRRKLSEAKLSHLTSKLEEQESYREEKVLQERCIALLKGKSARQLRAIVAFMEGHAEKEPEDVFPRGALMLGWGHNLKKPSPLCGQAVRCRGYELPGCWRQGCLW
jgi:hypothetical protein